jgi:HlyD family secretion protein
MGRRTLIVAIVLAAIIAASVGAYFRYQQAEPPPRVTTARVVRGDVAETVGATGALQAVTTVQVGTQVSGTIQNLYADFNSIVHKGQVLARLDPSLFQTQIEQARANLIRADADLERLRVSVADAQTKLARAQELSQRQLIPRTELEAAQVALQSAQAQVRSQQAQVTQAQASLNQNQVNLQHTVIEAPIDGLVISRNVDVGQTVAASMQAPTLFVLAADLTKMQVLASLDESDVGRIRPGQEVWFRVDAYPADEFEGRVEQVRLQPQTVQNVVTYSTVIAVPNPELKLKPGMTANVTIEIARRNNVLRVPNGALRFRPTPEIFAALGQPPVQAPAEPAVKDAGPGGGERGGAGGSSARGAGGSPPATNATQPRRQEPPQNQRAASAPAPRTRGEDASTERVGRGDTDGSEAGATARGTGGGRGRGDRGNFMERLQSLPPEQREQMLARTRARGSDPAASQTPSAPQRPARVETTRPSRPSSATTIDALFGPLPTVETIGRVWLHVDGKLSPLRLRLGISDGQATELLEGDVTEGAEVVTAVSVGAERPAAGAGGAAFPFFGGGGRGFPGGGVPGGGFGGGGRGGGRGQ